MKIHTLLLVALLTSQAVAQIAPYAENFDSGTRGAADCLLTGTGTFPAGWTDGGGTGSFTVWSGGTGSPSTGPADDLTGGGQYVFTEASNGCSSSEFILLSPNVDISRLANPTLRTNLHLRGTNIGTILIEEADGMGGWIQIDSLSGSGGDQWIEVQAPLMGAGGFSQVRYRVTGATGFSADVAIDNVSFDERFLAPPPPVPTAPEFQSNSSESTLLADGGTFSNQETGSFFSIDSTSSLVGLPYEIYAQVGRSVGLSDGGLSTAGFQTFNLSLNPATTVGVNQLLFGTVLPHPGAINFQVFAGSEFSTSAQQLVAAPANADGFTLSAAVTIESTVVRGVNRLSLIDDDAANITLTTPIPFMGTLFSDLWVNSNFLITFGGADIDFSPSVVDALNDNARLAAWTDGDPSSGGRVSWTEDAAGFTVYYDGVPFFGESIGNSLAIRIDGAGVCTLDFAGWAVNPLNSVASGDRLFIGLSGGLLNGATDAGPTPFRAGGSGGNTAGTNMIYNFFSSNDLGGQITPGLANDIASLLTGGGLLQFTPGLNPGEYSWAGL